MKGIRSSKADYQMVLEGVTLTSSIIKAHSKTIEDNLDAICNPEVLGGEDGAKFCRDLKHCTSVIESVDIKLGKILEQVQEICKKNGSFVTVDMSGGFDAIQKRFETKAEEIKTTVKTMQNQD